MKQSTVIVVSGAMAMTAINALASVQDKISLEPDDASVSEEMLKAIEVAMGRQASLDRVNSVFGTLASIIKEGDQTIADKYFRGDVEKLAAVTDDSTISDISSCYSNCYGNCHSACHGSRGWR